MTRDYICFITMSVVFGLLQYHQKPVDQETLHTMLQRLNHWKADQASCWQDGSIGLGHLMLYNTPESLEEKLPYYDSTSRLSITADARIDNREELFKKLDIAPSLQHTIADSRLLLKAYEKYGPDCVLHLIGDFAFTVWDEKNQQLFCARDHMGAKPFFYYSDNHFFAFASEKKGLLALPAVDKTINRQFLYNQLVFPPEQDPDTTLYEKILRLPPAHTLTVHTDGRVRLQEYWTLDAFAETRLTKKEDYYEGLRHHFEEAVRCRTRSHYKVGAELSGGLDSSAITGVAHALVKEAGAELITFSNTLPEGVTDESLLVNDEKNYINDVIRFNGIQSYEYITRPGFDTLLEEIELSLFVNDGLERTNMRWQLALKKAAGEKNVRTLLSGFPGDQMVTSRTKNYYLDYLDKKQYLRYFLASRKLSPGFNKLRPFAPAALLDGLRAVKNLVARYEPEVRKAATGYYIPHRYKKAYKKGLLKSRLFRENLRSYRHAQKFILLKPVVGQRMESETRFGIYFRLEPRFPLADIRLTQFYSSIPNPLKYENPISRSLFREAVKKFLPDSVFHRDDKSGSVAPFLPLNRKEEVYLIRDLFSQLPPNPLIKKEVLTKAIKSMSTAVPADLKKVPEYPLIIPRPELLLWLIRVNGNISGR